MKIVTKEIDKLAEDANNLTDASTIQIEDLSTTPSAVTPLSP